jgi:hypothetical protein
VDGHEATTADIAAAGIRNSLRIADGNGSVYSVAPFF